MSKNLAAFTLIASLVLATAASAQETTLLCRFAKFTVTESDARPGPLRTLHEGSLAIPRSILVTVDDATGAVSTSQKNMLLDRVSFKGGEVAAHIQHASDKAWLFGEETDGAPVLIVDVKNRIGTVMAQLKSDNANKLALSSGLCRSFRMQTPQAEPQVQASATLAPNAN
jgi:hypothetical protein